MRKGSEIIRSAKHPNDLSQLQRIVNNLIPCSLKTFLTYFHLGENGFHNAHRKFEPENHYMPITFVYFDSQVLEYNLRISHFCSLKWLEELWQEYVTYKSLYEEYRLLPLAYTMINQNFVYVKLDDEGSIWYHEEFYEDPPFQIADNVFDFIFHFSESNIVDQDFENKNAIRNWNEDFWSIADR